MYQGLNVPALNVQAPRCTGSARTGHHSRYHQRDMSCKYSHYLTMCIQFHAIAMNEKFVTINRKFQLVVWDSIVRFK